MTHYDVLGVPPAADDATVRRAYVALARRHHPDRQGGDAAKMRDINAAWATLGDAGRRAQYDRALAEAAGGGRAGPTWSSEGSAATAWPAPSARDDLDDDRPLHGTVRLPGWLSLIPVGLFVGSIVLFVGGLVFASAPLFGLALMSLVLSTLLFLAAPFIALLVARTGGRHDTMRR